MASHNDHNTGRPEPTRPQGQRPAFMNRPGATQMEQVNRTIAPVDTGGGLLASFGDGTQHLPDSIKGLVAQTQTFHGKIQLPKK